MSDGSQSRRRALGAATTFAVAAVAAVVGGRVTGRLTPALMLFVALVVVGMALTYWLDYRANSPSAERQEESTQGSGSVDLRGAQGVQLGDDNRQENYFGQDNDG